MRELGTGRRAVVCALMALTLTTAVGACSDSGSGPSGTAAKDFTIWDPYPQFDANSDWVKLLSRAGRTRG